MQSPSQMLDQILRQGESLDRLTMKALAVTSNARRFGDRVLHFLTASADFIEGSNPVLNLVFNVPADSDYEAVRFCLYPQIRKVSYDTATQGVSDRTFRATMWSWASTLQFDIVSDAVLELFSSSEQGSSHSYQNAAFSVAQVFSGPALPNLVAGVPPMDGYPGVPSPGGLVFDEAWKLNKGSTLTARVTPLYSGINVRSGVSDARQFEYRYVGVVEGRKIVDAVKVLR